MIAPKPLIFSSKNQERASVLSFSDTVLIVSLVILVNFNDALLFKFNQYK